MNTLRIGSRGSKLARAQSEWVAAQLKKVHSNLEIEFRWIVTTGDKSAEQAVSTVGGKGVFVKEIEEALLKKEIDLAVHSLKDVPQDLPFGLRLAPFPLREDARDVLISRFGEQLHELPRGSSIGTSAPRRQAQILKKYAARYRVVPIRGNVDTRLKKLQNGDYDAIVMAYAGLKRLGLEAEISQVLEPHEMLPALGQGCLGLEIRTDDAATLELIAPLKHDESDIAARAERSFLQALGGDCFTPVAGFSKVHDRELKMEAMLLDSRGEKSVLVEEKGSIDEPELVGAKLAGRLLSEGGSEILLSLDDL